jgi:hypothetical protein
VPLDDGEKTATTGDNGRFVFKDVPPGKHKPICIAERGRIK